MSVLYDMDGIRVQYGCFLYSVSILCTVIFIKTALYIIYSHYT